jgi:hypothetical protein
LTPQGLGGSMHFPKKGSRMAASRSPFPAKRAGDHEQPHTVCPPNTPLDTNHSRGRRSDAGNLLLRRAGRIAASRWRQIFDPKPLVDSN